ncbi:MAG TPA: aldehyde dehydrogenase family protein, partial [Pseudolysinimonas sp.]|nr:aldehyde dehydrogenase family protein [Pseudolysinimonas sp.]
MAVMDKVVVPLEHLNKFFIDGAWVSPSSGDSFKVIDSGTEKLFFSVAEAQKADMDRAVAAARNAFDNGPWPRMTHVERGEYLHKIADALQRRMEDVAQIFPRQSGIVYGGSHFITGQNVEL